MKITEYEKILYTKIGKVCCPALQGEYIAFTNEGFKHLLRKGRMPRTRNDQIRRLLLIPYIEKIVTNPKAVVAYEKRDVRIVTKQTGQKIILNSVIHFWTLSEKIQNRVIKVVIRQTSPHQKHFLSIMDSYPKNKKSHKK